MESLTASLFKRLSRNWREDTRLCSFFTRYKDTRTTRSRGCPDARWGRLNMPLRLFEIHEQPWFPQFLRDQFVDGLQMILEVTNIYEPIAQLLRERLEECGSERVLDLCSGAGGPWPFLARHFAMQGARLPEVFLTDKYPITPKLRDCQPPTANRIHFLRRSIDATQIPEHLQGFRTLFSSFHHLNP